MRIPSRALLLVLLATLCLVGVSEGTDAEAPKRRRRKTTEDPTEAETVAPTPAETVAPNDSEGIALSSHTTADQDLQRLKTSMLKVLEKTEVSSKKVDTCVSFLVESY